MRYHVEIQVTEQFPWERSTTFGGEYKKSELKCLRARIRKVGVRGAKYRIQGVVTQSTIKP